MYAKQAVRLTQMEEMPGRRKQSIGFWLAMGFVRGYFQVVGGGGAWLAGWLGWLAGCSRKRSAQRLDIPLSSGCRYVAVASYLCLGYLGRVYNSHACCFSSEHSIIRAFGRLISNSQYGWYRPGGRALVLCGPGPLWIQYLLSYKYLARLLFVSIQSD